MSPPTVGRARSSARLLFAFLLALALPGPALAEGGKIELSSCRLRGGVQARCGTLDVPEDRQHPEGRHLKLRVAVVPALARAPKPDPLFLLAGGPGTAATEVLAGLVPQAFEKVHRSRDVVLVDQRGTGGSNPLKCELVARDAPLAEKLSDQDFPAAKLRACLAGYAADPRLYGTSIAMQDLDEVRAALGYAQIDLWGGSYGTRAALVYLREHGQNVRTVVLDGVAPTTMRLPLHFAEDAQRSIGLLFQACADEPACAKAWPDLPARFDRLVARLDRSPVTTTLSDPLTGAPSAVTISRDLLTGVVRGVLYQPQQAALVPLVIGRAEAGDYGPLVALGVGWGEAVGEAMSLGMMLSVLCSEDVPRFGEAELQAKTQGTFLGARIIQGFRGACQVWPRGEVAADFGEPVRSDKPVLLLSGELDPVTPPVWAEEAAKTLPNSARFTAPGVGHGVSTVGCAPRLIAEFIESASTKDLDGSCLQKQKRPPFFASFAGPTP